jgi:hypothetical protein
MKFRGKRPFNPKVLLADASRAAGDGPISSRRKKGEMTRGARWVVGLFFGMFLAVGLAATYAFAVRPWVKVWAARSWTPVTCHILSSEVTEHHGDSTTYGVAIAYVYEIDGRAYEGTRYDFTTGSSSGRKAKKAIVANYREGRETVCYVNPANPAEAVIERSRVRDWGFGLMPLVFVLVGAGGVVFSVRGQRKAGAQNRSAGEWRRSEKTRFTTRTAPLEDFSEEARAAGAAELKPVQSRVGMLVGLVVFALFWNGIVSVFVVNIIGDAMRGGGIGWVFLLFLLPFVGIGLFLIGLVVRQAMSLANPVPRLIVSRRAFSPGETVELTWRFDGARRRLKDARLWLEGREEATYRRGTDTKTDKEVFATLEIAAVSGLASGEPSQATVRLPERLMHSFKSDNNRVSWSLRVTGSIRLWPDVDEEFAISIMPAARRGALSANPETLQS